MMTREDMLRELELLPVWRLRQPLFSYDIPILSEEKLTKVDTLQAKTPVDVHEKQEAGIVRPTLDLQEVELEAPQPSITAEDIETPPDMAFLHIASEDSRWLFVMENVAMTADTQRLFQNICKAIQIKTKFTEVSAMTTTLISQIQPTLVILLGEAAAQAVLQSKESIINLRNQLHQRSELTLIATYDLAHMLQNPADKAKVWSDLCLGLQALSDLSAARS